MNITEEGEGMRGWKTDWRGKRKRIERIFLMKRKGGDALSILYHKLLTSKCKPDAASALGIASYLMNGAT